MSIPQFYSTPLSWKSRQISSQNDLLSETVDPLEEMHMDLSPSIHEMTSSVVGIPEPTQWRQQSEGSASLVSSMSYDLSEEDNFLMDDVFADIYDDSIGEVYDDRDDATTSNNPFSFEVVCLRQDFFGESPFMNPP
ncbi:expressed unknown protein [Seminavis robusta]|uniref:Uncharacterized protein n=1 Tax=Seminavis robusta TaxID=568900 RepID=A0A9N8EUP7_9STRA|nr:expressed unknown protein [Seminavis robusta]|eukprot:Sro2249_g320720.1 n/a (136) ;mRNA; f:5339-5746